MAEPFDLLIAAISDEFGERPAIAALATVDARFHPRVRSVILRTVDLLERIIWVTTDARSDKLVHLAANPQAELCLYLPTLREQFRLAGQVRVFSAGADHPRRGELWRSLTDSGRAMFFWPPPGRGRVEGERFAASCADSAPPPTFAVLALAAGAVEHLDLKSFPHRRRRWTASGQWKCEDVNP